MSKKWIRLDPFIHTYTRTYQRNPPRKNEIQLFKFEIINRLEIIKFGQISLIYRSEMVARNNTKTTRLTLVRLDRYCAGNEYTRKKRQCHFRPDSEFAKKNHCSSLYSPCHAWAHVTPVLVARRPHPQGNGTTCRVDLMFHDKVVQLFLISFLFKEIHRENLYVDKICVHLWLRAKEDKCIYMI